MTKLEKIGLIIAIPSGVMTILEYLEKNNFISYFEWVPRAVKNIFSRIYENIILFEVNIWLVFILIYLSFKSYKFYQNRYIQNDNPIDYYQKMDINHKLVFNIVANYHNKNYECKMKDIENSLRQKKISNLELEQIMEDLENHYIIQSHPNWMAPTTYTLTDIGRNIAVELIKQKDDK